MPFDSCDVCLFRYTPAKIRTSTTTAYVTISMNVVFSSFQLHTNPAMFFQGCFHKPNILECRRNEKPLYPIKFHICLTKRWLINFCQAISPKLKIYALIACKYLKHLIQNNTMYVNTRSLVDYQYECRNALQRRAKS